MTVVHVHGATRQPATHYRYRLNTPTGVRTLVMEIPPRYLVFAQCCQRKRKAANLFVQVYYDGTWFYCVAGKGCRP